MTDTRYPKQLTDVEVNFLDGEVKTFTITTGLNISQYLAQEAASTGVLVLFNGRESQCIPLSSIRNYRLHNERNAPDGQETTTL